MKMITFPSQKTICTLLAAILALLIFTQARLNAQPQSTIPGISKESLASSVGAQWERNLEKELDELLVWMQPKPTRGASYKVVNTRGQIVYEVQEPNHLFVTDPKLKQLLRQSDLIVESQGVKYYLYEGKEMPLMVSQVKNISSQEKL